MDDSSSLRERLSAALGAHARGDADSAEALCRAVLDEAPQRPEALTLMGMLRRRASRLDEAERYYRQALACAPHYADAHHNLGNLLADIGQTEAALASFQRALALRPQWAAGHHRLGATLHALGRLDEALGHFERARVLDPHSADCRWDHALALLAAGRYREGWQEYESRWLRGQPPPRDFAQPEWRGGDLAGQRLLVHAEQGFGDALQFLRFVPQLEARGAHVILELREPLAPLVDEALGVEEIAIAGQPLPAFDLHVPLLSVPGVLGITLDDLPGAVPYLRAPRARILQWQARLRTDEFKVALVWAGNPNVANDRWRSPRLEPLRPVLDVAGVRFFAVQKGDGTRDLERLGPLANVTDLGPELHDFGDTAAALLAMDLVITTDTSVAHLAGALGCPVWLMLHAQPDWRWMHAGTKSRWYPTARLYRQRTLGDWTDVAAAVARDLRARVAEARGSRAGSAAHACGQHCRQLLQQAFELQRAGRGDQAEPLYRRVLAADPNEVNALQLLGLIYKSRGHLADAWVLTERALALRPHEPALLSNAGNLLRELGRLDDARDALEAALRHAPDHVDAWNNLGNVHKDAADYARAASSYRRALELDPAHADALNNLAGALLRQGNHIEAAALYRAALARRPDFAMAHYNLANLLADHGALDEAIEHLRCAVRIDPNYVEAINGLLRQLQATCDWADLPELQHCLRALGATSGKVFPFSFLAIDSTLAEQQQCARRWVQVQYAPHLHRAASHPLPHPARTDAGPIRIGYLSSDLHDHATAWLMAEVFELHDRRRFEVHAFSLGPDDGRAMRRRLLAAFDRFHDLRGLSWAQAAGRVHAERIDILVDLKGFTKDTGSPILAFRPAPIQVSYLGYPGTMGASFVDYLVTDRIVTPPADQDWFDERLAFMPASYQCNDRKRPIGVRPSRAACGLPDDAVVLACFNHTYKITPEVFAQWCEILAAVPGSVLWLLASNRWAEANLRREAALRGVAGDRLVFAPNRQLESHLARLQNADLVLDTRPYNAHTTASDALWAGVPVVTCLGETFASRVAASLLHAVGLPQLVAPSPDAYRELAIRLASDRAALAALRARLVEHRASAALFDSAAFTQALESLYEQMWRRWRSGEPPAQLHATHPNGERA